MLHFNYNQNNTQIPAIIDAVSRRQDVMFAYKDATTKVIDTGPVVISQSRQPRPGTW